jgi:hypothetical protein
MSEQEPKLVLPEWARWVTKNATGELVVHQEKPFKNKYCGGWYPPAGTRLAYLVGKKWETSLRYVTWDQKEPTPIRQSKNVIVVGSESYPNFSAVVSDENKTLKTVRSWMCEAAEAAFENSKMPNDYPDDAPAAVVDGPDDPKIALHKQITEELNAIYEAKNHDYGDSFQETYRKLGLISAVTRISDKVNRLQSLSMKEQRVADESLRDTLMDCANYCIMTIIALEEIK